AAPSIDERFEKAFHEWVPNFDVRAISPEVEKRLKGRSAMVRTEVIAALDEWANERRRQGWSWTHLQSLADKLAEPNSALASSRRRLLAMMGPGGNLECERALGMLAVCLRPVPVPFDAGPGANRADLRDLATKDVEGKSVPEVLALVRALQVAG